MLASRRSLVPARSAAPASIISSLSAAEAKISGAGRLGEVDGLALLLDGAGLRREEVHLRRLRRAAALR